MCAGLVSITGPCAVITPWAAFLVGGVGGVIYSTVSKLVAFKVC